MKNEFELIKNRFAIYDYILIIAKIKIMKRKIY